jgi:putative tail protein
MGRLGLTIGVTAIGTAAGAYFGAGSGALLGAQLGFMAGSILSAVALPGSGGEGPRLGDLRVGDASYGVSIPIVYGACQVAGMMIWTSGIDERQGEESQKGGPTTTTYTYFASCAIGLCEGPVASVRKIWFDSKLVYDVSAGNLGIVNKRIGELDPRGILDEDELADRREEITAEVEKVNSAMTIYLGTETQLPDPVIEAHEGAGEVPAHRGLAYLVFEDLPLQPYGNRIPQVRAEVLTAVSAAYPKRTVTPVGAMARDKFLFDGRRQQVWARNGTHIVQVNALDNTILQDQIVDTVPEAGAALVPGLGLATEVDVDGALYVPIAGALATNKLVRLDPVSLKWTHTGINGLTGLAVALSNATTIRASPHYIWYGAWYPTNELVCFTRPGALLSGLLPGGPPALVEEMALTGSYVFGGTETGVAPRMLAIDRDEACWAVCRAPIIIFDPRTILARMEPAGAVQLFDVTDAIKAASYVAYDELTHALIVLGAAAAYPDAGWTTSRVIRWDIATETVVDSADGITFGAYIESSWHHGIVGRALWTANDWRFFAFDVDTFTQVRAETVLGVGGFDGHFHYATIYDPGTHALWAMEDGYQFAKYFLDRQDPGTVTLGQVVADISTRAGLTPADDLDTTALSEAVWGYALSRRAEARASLEPLLAAHLVDAVESDWKIRYRHRGGLTPVAALTSPHLAAHAPGAELPDALTPARLPDLDLPVRLDVTYPDPDREYQDGTQSARRFQAPQQARGQRTAQTPVVMQADTAKTLAEQSLWEAWVQRQTYRLSLPYRWATLDPGDVVTATDPVTNRTHLLRLTSVEHGANGILEAQGVAYDGSIYTASEAQGTATTFAPQMLRPTTLTRLLLLDINLLRDVDEGAGLYLAAAPDGQGDWPGAAVFQSPEAESWQPYATVTQAVSWGAATTALADGSPYVFDRTHTVDVRFVQGAPSTATELAVLNGANALVLGNEILQFVTATLVSGTTYRLSTLLRGRRGTEWATATHAAGERAILVTRSTLQRGAMGVSDLARALLYRAVSFDADLLAASVVPFTNTGAGLKPYAPDHVAGTRDGSNNLTITWIRRTRIGGEWQDARDVPLGEEVESYEVDILDGGGAVVRTLTSTTQTVAYSAAQQTTDGVTPGDPITLIIYQMSATVGRGYARQATV